MDFVFKLLHRLKTMIIWKLISCLYSTDLIVNPYVFKLKALLCLETTDSWGGFSPAFCFQRPSPVRQTARDFNFT